MSGEGVGFREGGAGLVANSARSAREGVAQERVRRGGAAEAARSARERAGPRAATGRRSGSCGGGAALRSKQGR